MVPWKTNDPLDGGLAPVERINKSNDVAPFWVNSRKATNQNTIADKESIFHGT